MEKEIRSIFASTVAAGALLLLWYKRMMVAMPDGWQATFLVACAVGFVACGFALDRLRAGAWEGIGLDDETAPGSCLARPGQAASPSRRSPNGHAKPPLASSWADE